MRNLKIWQKGFDIAVNAFKLASNFPKEERYGLASQITRCAVSIPSNIAEGSSRTSDKDYNRFLEISLGSSFELETQILISKAAGFSDSQICNQMLADVDEEQKMLMAFIRKVNP